MWCVVSVFPLRDYSRRACWAGDGCYGACRLERDTCGDVSYQDERREGLSVTETNIAETVERRSKSPYAQRLAQPQKRLRELTLRFAAACLYIAQSHTRARSAKARGTQQVAHVQNNRNKRKAKSRSSPENNQHQERRQINDKLQLFSGFSWLVATCICSESASNVLELSKCFICSQLYLPKVSHAGAMLI